MMVCLVQRLLEEVKQSNPLNVTFSTVGAKMTQYMGHIGS